MNRRALLALLASALLALGLFGCAEEPVDEVGAGDEPVRVAAHLDSSDVAPGRPFLLTVTVDQAEGVQFELPDVGAKLQGLVLMDRRTEGPEAAGGRLVTREIYKLKAPVSGTYLVPGVEAPYRAPGDVVGTAGTGPILVEARRSGGEEATEETLRDIRGPREPDLDSRPWLVGSAAAALLLALGALAWWLWRRRSAIEEPPLSPAERARRDLEALLASGAADATDQGPFAYAVSAILRRYLEEVFGFPAWHMTTAEVLRAMPSRLSSRRELEAAIRGVLEASDLVKFAAERVPAETLRQWAAQVRTVVEATEPRPGDEEEAA